MQTVSSKTTTLISKINPTDGAKRFNPLHTVLDKLEQLTLPLENQQVELSKVDRGQIGKEAMRKAIGQAMSHYLGVIAHSEGNEKMRKYFLRGYWCRQVIHQRGKMIASTTCGCRHCPQCRSIRAGVLINQYKDTLEKQDEMYFVTLTVKSPFDWGLSRTIKEMIEQWRTMMKTLSKSYKLLGLEKGQLKGLRKLECNYNNEEKTYNPHFHILVNSRSVAMWLKMSWLTFDHRRSRKAQDVQKVNDIDKSLLELMKYATKDISKHEVNYRALYNIYCSLFGVRTIQPFGSLKAVKGLYSRRLHINDSTLPYVTEDAHDWQPDLFDWVSQNSNNSLHDQGVDKILQELIPYIR
jgi:hypothetical protein